MQADLYGMVYPIPKSIPKVLVVFGMKWIDWVTCILVLISYVIPCVNNMVMYFVPGDCEAVVPEEGYVSVGKGEMVLGLMLRLYWKPAPQYGCNFDFSGRK